MSKVTGMDAINALNAGEDSNNTEFTSFKSGSKFIVKVLGTADLMEFYNYSIFKQVNSFVAEKPSTKTAKGFPIDNYTPWDLAFLYHRNKSEEWTDEHAQEASKYRPKQRFAMGFFDLDSGEQFVVDVSKKQAQAIHGAIMKNEKRLDTFAFELAKEGSGTETTVSLMPMLDDLTDKQQENFDNAPEEFDESNFEGILYEMDEEEQLEKMTEVGFDVTKIGYDKPSKDSGSANEGQGEGSTEEYPF